MLLILDSLGHDQIEAENLIRDYLDEEFRLKNNGTIKSFFSTDLMAAVRPKKPEQQNMVDCGIFLLYYVEKMFQRYLR